MIKTIREEYFMFHYSFSFNVAAICLAFTCSLSINTIATTKITLTVQINLLAIKGNIYLWESK